MCEGHPRAGWAWTKLDGGCIGLSVRRHDICRSPFLLFHLWSLHCCALHPLRDVASLPAPADRERPARKSGWMALVRNKPGDILSDSVYKTIVKVHLYAVVSVCVIVFHSWLGCRPAKELWGLSSYDSVPWMPWRLLKTSQGWALTKAQGCPLLLERVLQVSRDNQQCSWLTVVEPLHWLQQSHLHHAIYVSREMAHWVNWDYSSLYQYKICAVFVHFLL